MQWPISIRPPGAKVAYRARDSHREGEQDLRLRVWRLNPDTADVDPSLVRHGENITPTTCPRPFIFDRHLYRGRRLDVGHIMLTSSHVTEFVQRIGLEKDRSGQIPGYDLRQCPSERQLLHPLDGQWNRRADLR